MAYVKAAEDSRTPHQEPRTPPTRHLPEHRVEQTLHRSMYLGIQRLRGRPVGKLMRRLARWEALDPAAQRRNTDERLRGLLAHAAAQVPLYRSEPWRSALARSAAALEAWPVLDRSRLHQSADALVAEGWRSALLYTRRSSASTGRPVLVKWNLDGVAWSWAAEYHPMRWHGLDIGARTLRMWGSGRRFENWILNRHFVPADALTPERLNAAIAYIEAAKPAIVWGTPSAVHELARHIGRTRPAARLNVPFIKVGGEQLYAFQREEIERWLGARLIESYGSTEMGPMAAECPEGSLHVLTTNVHLEIFRDGAPVAPGEEGDVIATTLINRGMPLVRCRIGDTAALSPDPCPCGRPMPVLTRLRGRANDYVLRTDGTGLHGAALGEALARYADRPPLGAAQKVRFEQRDQRRWLVMVELPEEVPRDGLDVQIEDLLRATIGDGFALEIEAVKRIPRERSGKFRYYRTLSMAPPAD